MAETLLTIGTRKGLFLASSTDDRRTWELDGPHFAMNAVYSVAIDTRGEQVRLLAGADSDHWGPSVFYSDDRGATWSDSAEAPIKFPAATGASLERVWQLQPAGADQPDVVWAGTEPAALWRSADRGATFELVDGLWNHPHRPQWHPGGGGQCLHTILPGVDDPASVMVGISTGGVYRTSDGGESWDPSNGGIAAPFLPPDEPPEFGQCVHKIARHPSRPEQLYLQNHGGVYRSDDGGSSWTSIADGLPADFGFPIVVHPHRPGTAYVFPLVGDYRRLPPDARCRVYRTDDAGDSWTELAEGLPDEGTYFTVLRDAFCADDAERAGLYFGTRTGEVFASRDEGDSWTSLVRHLPDVLVVRAAQLA